MQPVTVCIMMITNWRLFKIDHLHGRELRNVQKVIQYGKFTFTYYIVLCECDVCSCNHFINLVKVNFASAVTG